MCTLGAVIGMVLLPLNPVHHRMLVLTYFLCIFGIWIGSTLLVWKQKNIRAVFLMIPALAILPFLLTDKPMDSEALRRAYLQRLTDLEGATYHWGGESPRGIDCSGLPRKALRDALFTYGIRHLNRQAIREYFKHAWYDASAKALGDGYQDYTVSLETTGTILHMSYDHLQPGDLAVTDGGDHILVYAGDGQWIQADPGIGYVTTLHGRRDPNVWFEIPVTTHRWQLLSLP